MRFCERFLQKRDRTYDQIVQEARSGKQNIIEGSQASGTSKEMEIKLTNVVRASREELLEDYRDFLRVRRMEEWSKDAHDPPLAWPRAPGKNRRDEAKICVLPCPSSDFRFW